MGTLNYGYLFAGTDVVHADIGVEAFVDVCEADHSVPVLSIEQCWGENLIVMSVLINFARSLKFVTCQIVPMRFDV